jgi:NADPH-dependent 2,4-dienoyl-CoA reductase/sulfur reductase-like enzyme
MAIDLDERKVEVHDHSRDRTINLGFDQLHIATGARPLRPDIPGIDLPRVMGVQTLDDAHAILARAELTDCKHVTVVGGGYIGLEMAEAFVRWGAEVTLVEATSQVMRTLDPDIAAKVTTAIRGFGVDVRTDLPVTGFEEGVVHTSEGEHHTDLVVLGMGVTPNADLAADAGLELGPRGSISVDRRQRTSADGVWAAGDCASSFHLVTGEPVHIALGTVANKQGRVAGVNIGGGYATFPGVVGTAITKICALEISRTGLSEHEAATAGFSFDTATIDTKTIAHYMPGAEDMTVKMLAEQGSGRILGAQIIGGRGAGKRIDAVATALHAGMDVQQMIDLDLSYAPPFSGVWDPVQMVARRLVRND